jgi:hypothetical protein
VDLGRSVCVRTHGFTLKHSTVGTKPTMEVQLESVAFDGRMVLQIFRSSQFIDGIYVVIYRISSCESSSFILNVILLYFILLDGSDKNTCVGINQVIKGGILTTEEG